jgi:hypothetical protein
VFHSVGWYYVSHGLKTTPPRTIFTSKSGMKTVHGGVVFKAEFVVWYYTSPPRGKVDLFEGDDDVF